MDVKLNSPALQEWAKNQPAEVATETVPTETVVETTPEVTDKIETPTETKEVVNPPEPQENDWDETPATIETKPDVAIPELDFSELGKSIGFEEVKTKDDLVSKVKELKALEGVPDNFKAALEIAKKGGDWQSFLGVSQVDYASVDSVELFKNDLYSRIKQLNPGKTKEELETVYAEALGNYAPIQQLIEGDKLKKGYMDWQKQETARIQHEAAQKKQIADQRIKETIDKIEDINGFKLKSTHKAKMYDYITSGQLQKDLFSQEGYNYQALAEIAFARNFGKKANEFLWNKAKTAGTKEVITELTNPQITKPAEKVQPETKEVHPLEAWLQQLKEKNRGGK